MPYSKNLKILDRELRIFRSYNSAQIVDISVPGPNMQRLSANIDGQSNVFIVVNNGTINNHISTPPKSGGGLLKNVMNVVRSLPLLPIIKPED